MAKINLSLFSASWRSELQSATDGSSVPTDALAISGSMALAVSGNFLAATVLSNSLTREILRGLANKDKVVETHKFHLLNSLASIHDVECDELLLSNIESFLLITPMVISAYESQLKAIERLSENDGIKDSYGDAIKDKKNQVLGLLNEMLLVQSQLKERLDINQAQRVAMKNRQSESEAEFSKIFSDLEREEQAISDLFAAKIISQKDFDSKVLYIKSERGNVNKKYCCQYLGFFKDCKKVAIPGEKFCSNHLCNEPGCNEQVAPFDVSSMNKIFRLGDFVQNLMGVNKRYCENHEAVIGYDSVVDARMFTKNRSQAIYNKHPLEEYVRSDRNGHKYSPKQEINWSTVFWVGAGLVVFLLVIGSI